MAASNMTVKRISRELPHVSDPATGSIQLAPSDDSMFNWSATLPGPEGSPYEGGEFQLAIQLPPDYPFSAPKVSFKTRIYHMNVSDPGGQICIDILKSNWSAALSLYKVVLSISSLLTDPNPGDPLVPQIADLYRRNRKQHDATARTWTEQYARPKPKPAAAEASKPAASSIVNLIDAEPPVSSARTRSSRSAVTGRRRPPQTIDLSADEQPSASARTAIPPSSAENPIEIESSPEPGGTERSSSAQATIGRKRRRTHEDADEEENGRASRRRNHASSSRANGHADAEIIVLD
ncbi:hypothetical protein CALCODRAFT_526690 [Calocera cornea HHB12733]|uniref:E2 ubiquitin-conjugating enzyme n=1 Tax=Calocera cornea HHB12733 TaxID=1353952 RepID=A0A165EB79_9BASI|nr:hypothetical protein CALCODRAFT_526690 [Calocera cornea HHB12733]